MVVKAKTPPKRRRSSTRKPKAPLQSPEQRAEQRGGFTDPHVVKAIKYCEDVVSGLIPACKWVKLACRRQLRDLERFGRRPDADGRFYFDEGKAGHACRFIELLPHIEGPAAFLREDGEPNCITLEPWQCFIVTSVFGWRRTDTGGRRFRRVYIEVPRGNGKSALSSAIALYGLAADDEAGPQVFTAATTREQASVVYDISKKMMRTKPGFAKKLGVVPNDHILNCLKNNGFMRALSREAKSLDGKNLHVGIIDELHAHQTREVYDVLETAMGKRLKSLLFIITTAGVDSAGICYEIRTYVTKILEGNAEDETQFGIIYTLDLPDPDHGVVGDDWRDPASWAKANPNWGVSVMPDEIASLAHKAMQLPPAQANFKTKHLNLWVNANQAAFDLAAWDRCADPDLTLDQFLNTAPNAPPCVIGLDLATKIDLACKVYNFFRDLPKCARCGLAEINHNAPTLVIEPVEQEIGVAFTAKEPVLGPDGKPLTRAKVVEPCQEGFAAGERTERHHFIFVECYIPDAAVRSGVNSQYEGWEIEGLLKVGPGEVTDFELIELELEADAEHFGVVELAYDPWQATPLAKSLEKKGFDGGRGPTLVEVRMTNQNLSEPFKDIDALMRQRRLHHNANKVMRWMISNVVKKEDAKGHWFPTKEKPELKIDGPVALILSQNRAGQLQGNDMPYSSSRGIR